MEKRLIVTKKVEKGIVSFEIEGKDDYGRDFCGHTQEASGSLYWQEMNAHALHYYGNYKKDFAKEKAWPKMQNKDTAQEYANKIKKRILMIREWVKKCKKIDKELCSIGVVVIPD
jgi:hypothetical protein